MNNEYTIKPIAYIRCGFATKFGVPRQSGLVSSVPGKIVFEPEYRNRDALRGLEGFSHIWLIWGFSKASRDTWSPTVRPPRLGGNTRMGVFATRSPFRPNHLALSSVKLVSVDDTPENGTVLHVSGADLMDGTPIYDIKPYLPYTDIHRDATDGFTSKNRDYSLNVDFPPELLSKFPESEKNAVIGILSQDPRPSYHDDENRVYGFVYAGFEIKFKVAESTLTVISAEKA